VLACRIKCAVRMLLTASLFLCFISVPGSAETLYSSDFTNPESLKSFYTLVPPKAKDIIKISKGNLLMAAGKNSSIDLITGNGDWADYALMMNYKLILPHANSGIDVCVRNLQIQPQDQPGGISIHFKRHQKTGKPIRWIRQYGNRDRDVMPDQNAPVFDDGKWHELKLSVKGRDLIVEIDGEEFFSMEDVLDIERGNVMISVSDGARLTIREFKVESLP
jgi:hypothetical protein